MSATDVPNPASPDPTPAAPMEPAAPAADPAVDSGAAAGGEAADGSVGDLLADAGGEGDGAVGDLLGGDDADAGGDAGDSEPATDGDTDTDPAADADGDQGDVDADADEKPIEYEFEAPEGVEFRSDVIDTYKDALQKHRVAPEVANDLLQTMLPAIQKDFAAQIKEQDDKRIAEWQAESKERHGKALGEIERLRNVALDKLVDAKVISPEFRDNVLGGALAANSDFSTAFAAFGQRLSNDRPPKNDGQRAAKEQTAVQEAADEYERSAKRG